jgi:hypothetical protein
MVKDASSGSFHSASLVPCSDSVRMTGLCGVSDVGILVGIRHGYREAAAEPILHHSVSPRLDLRYSGWQVVWGGVTGIGCRAYEAVWRDLVNEQVNARNAKFAKHRRNWKSFNAEG